MNIKLRKLYLVKEVGEWKFTFHYKEGSIEKTFLSITSTSGMFNCRIGGRNEMYYFLLHVAMKDDIAVLSDYVSRLFILASVWNDTELVKDVNSAIKKWNERVEEKGAEKAKAVTETEEMASQVFMEQAVEYAAATPSERKRISERDKAEMRNIIKHQ